MNNEQKTEQKVELENEQLKAVAGGALSSAATELLLGSIGDLNLGEELKLGKISHW